MKTVFITGATGTMGKETLKKFIEDTEEFHVKILARDSKKNRDYLSSYENEIEVIWGDLKDKDQLYEGVKGSDYVLHIGAFLSPFADEHPEEAMLVNYGSTLHMLNAIKKYGQEEITHFVYIGTVAQTGDRMPPIHWGRVGDPMKPSIYDYYAVSKCAAERAVIESGLKYWVSIRQTGMLPVNQSSGEYPIISHQPYNNCLEWSNAEDSGNLMRNVCKDRVPDKFWRKVYNLSNGADYRKTCFELSMDMGGDPRKTQEPNWMSLGNFHGHFYTDADDLEALVPFRTKSYSKQIEETMQGFLKMAELTGDQFVPPTPEQMKEHNREVISRKGGVLQFIKDNDEERIKVWFGSKERYEQIPEKWDECIISKPLMLPSFLDHGFDESKPIEELNIEDMKRAAEFRGGKCLSETMNTGNMYQPLKWECASGHIFKATPYTVLFAGHWCPDCMCGEWKYGEDAQVNPFFAQVWEPLHKGEESYRVKMIADAKMVEDVLKED